MATEIKITDQVKDLARDLAIDLLQKEVKDLTDRVEKLEAQFTWPTSLSSDWTYVKENPWNDEPIIMWKDDDTALSKKSENATWKATYEDLSTWSNND